MLALGAIMPRTAFGQEEIFLLPERGRQSDHTGQRLRQCKASNAGKVETILLELIGPARQEDGCLYYDLYKRGEAPAKFYILDGWRDQTALDAHLVHPNVKSVVDRMTPLLSKPISVTITHRISDAG